MSSTSHAATMRCASGTEKPTQPRKAGRCAASARRMAASYSALPLPSITSCARARRLRALPYQTLPYPLPYPGSPSARAPAARARAGSPAASFTSMRLAPPQPARHWRAKVQPVAEHPQARGAPAPHAEVWKQPWAPPMQAQAGRRESSVHSPQGQLSPQRDSERRAAPGYRTPRSATARTPRALSKP